MKTNKLFSKITAWVIAFTMILGTIPITAIGADQSAMFKKPNA